MTVTDFPESMILSQGFYRWGVARLPLPQSAQDAFKGWLEGDNHADMSWMGRDALSRFSGESVLAGARSVLVMAAPNYPHADGGVSAVGSGQMRVADFALGDDYHYVLRERGQAVADALTEVYPGAEWRVCVDSSPLAERTAAVMAGIGQVGRNGMVVDVDSPHGSRFFLVCIVTDAVLPVTEVSESDVSSSPCGDCRLCVDACPGGALQFDCPFDARRCVSWLTIEKREPLTDEEHRMAGFRLFGCDVCQDVCPYNRAPVLSPFAALHDGVRISSLVPASLFATGGSVTSGEFRRRFTGSALRRAGLRRLRARADWMVANEKAPRR